MSRSLIFLSYSELSENEIEESKTPTSSARAVLTTNYAENAVTIEDIDVVLDSGLARCASSIVE